MPSVLDLIGNTPMIEATRLDRGRCQLFLKLENQNPGGSIKDRIALSMIEAAEREKKIQPGSLIVEATAGNTGLGLALVASQKGYRLLIVVPDKMSQEKIFHLKALGAEVRLTRSDVTKGHPEYYQDMAARIARETPGAFYVNQFGNEANPWAHEHSTGPEIWQQMEQRVDAVVCGVGTGGTLTGLSRFFAKVAPQAEMVLADPQGSILTPLVRTGKAPDHRMKLYDVSQLPVLRAGRIVGIVDEEDILAEVYDNPQHFNEPVTEAMESHLVTVPPTASIGELMDIFKRGMVAIVVDGEEFLGFITRIDLLNWLRRRLDDK